MKYERALQEQELKILDHFTYRRNAARKKQLWFFSIYICLALVVGTIAYFKVDPENRTILFLTIAGYMIAGVWAIAELRIKENKRWKNIIYLKNKNLVTVVQVQSDRYYLLDEQEDEGVFYLFQLPNNEVLSFGGQSFYEDDHFPNNNFEIVVGYGAKNEILFLETYVKGEKRSLKKL